MATGRIGVTPTLRTRWSREPAGGTTSLSGLDDNSVSLVYDVGYEQVYRNGVLLSRGNDYTATDGTTITLIDATIAGDIIEVFANQSIPLSDAISRGQFTAKGSLLSATAASTPAVLAVGSNNQVLTADSAEATGLKWATVSAGGMTLLSTTTLTGQTTSITNISQDYTDLIILVYGVLVSANNNWIACNFRNGSTLLPLYNGGRITGFDTTNQNAATHWLGAAAGQSNTISRNNFLIYVKNYTATGQMEKHIEERSFYYNASTSGYDFTLFTGLLDTTSPLNELLFDAAGTTTFSAGTVKIYGVK